MTSVPPRPELPDAAAPESYPPPGEWAPPVPPELPERAPARTFAPWAPFAALVCAYALAVVAAVLIGAVVAAAGGHVSDDDLPTGVVLAATLIQDLLLVGFTLLFARASGVELTPAVFGLR